MLVYIGQITIYSRSSGSPYLSTKTCFPRLHGKTPVRFSHWTPRYKRKKTARVSFPQIGQVIPPYHHLDLWDKQAPDLHDLHRLLPGIILMAIRTYHVHKSLHLSVFSQAYLVLITMFLHSRSCLSGRDLYDTALCCAHLLLGREDLHDAALGQLPMTTKIGSVDDIHRDLCDVRIIYGMRFALGG